MVQHYCRLPLQYNHNGKPIQPALTEIGVMRDNLPPLARVKCGEGHLGKRVAQKIQSKPAKQPHLVAGAAFYWWFWHRANGTQPPPLCPVQGPPTGLSQPPLPPLPGGDHSSPLCHSLSLVAGPCILPCHFTFRGEQGGRNVHYRW